MLSMKPSIDVIYTITDLKSCHPPLPYPWKGLAKGPFSSEASVGGRGVG